MRKYVKLAIDILLVILNVIAACVADNTFSLACFIVASICWVGCVVFDIMKERFYWQNYGEYNYTK